MRSMKTLVSGTSLWIRSVPVVGEAAGSGVEDATGNAVLGADVDVGRAGNAVTFLGANVAAAGDEATGALDDDGGDDAGKLKKIAAPTTDNTMRPAPAKMATRVDPVTGEVYRNSELPRVVRMKRRVIAACNSLSRS